MRTQIIDVRGTVGSPIPNDRATESIVAILDSVELCALATVSAEGRAHINTCYFARDPRSPTLYILTPPASQHSRNLDANKSISVAVYSTQQPFVAAKCGLQLSGTGHRVNDGDVSAPLGVYGARFPALLEGLEDKTSLQGLESRFYCLSLQRGRLFDEPRFGSEVWIDVTFER